MENQSLMIQTPKDQFSRASSWKNTSIFQITKATRKTILVFGHFSINFNYLAQERSNFQEVSGISGSVDSVLISKLFKGVSSRLGEKIE